MKSSFVFSERGTLYEYFVHTSECIYGETVHCLLSRLLKVTPLWNRHLICIHELKFYTALNCLQIHQTLDNKKYTSWTLNEIIPLWELNVVHQQAICTMEMKLLQQIKYIPYCTTQLTNGVAWGWAALTGSFNEWDLDFTKPTAKLFSNSSFPLSLLSCPSSSMAHDTGCCTVFWSIF